MEPSPDEERPEGPSPVADAIGGATVFPARIAARVLRGPLETAVEDLLSAPEIGRILDRALSGTSPEELANSLARHQVLERVVRKLAANGELERLLEAALSSPHTLEAVDQALSSDAMGHVLQRALTGPEARAAVAKHSTGFAGQVAGGLRHAAANLDRKLTFRTTAVPAPSAGVASRGAALALDAFAITAISVALGAAGALVGALVGGVQPRWLADLLVSLAALAIALGYFSLF